MAVGDGVAEGDEGERAGGSSDVDTGQLVPVLDFAGAREVGGGEPVAVRYVGRGVGARMGGLLLGRLIVMDADGEIASGRERKIETIGDIIGSGGDGDVGVAGEGEGLVGRGIDGGGGVRDWTRDVDRGKVQRRGTEGVGQAHAQGWAAG